jgi:hypothetical protein
MVINKNEAAFIIYVEKWFAPNSINNITKTE